MHILDIQEFISNFCPHGFRWGSGANQVGITWNQLFCLGEEPITLSGLPGSITALK